MTSFFWARKVFAGNGFSEKRWRSITALLGVAAGLILLGAREMRAQSTLPLDTQVIQLQAGWNAIHLNVEPTDSRPEVVFGGAPITKVATFFPTRSPVEFIQDPASPSWKQQGWSIWYASVLPESAVSDLSAIIGGQGYLIFATARATLNVSGTVKLNRIRWRADSFNFVGFPVDPVSPPTFTAWFAGSTAQMSTTRRTIFALDGSGHWRAVDHPEATQIQPNAAYWIFCAGGSEYQGPLDITLPLGVPKNGADFGAVTETIPIRFRNLSGVPIRFGAELSPANSLPVSYEARSGDQATRSQAALSPAVTFDPLEAGGQYVLRLTLDRALMTTTNGTAVLTVRDDVGSFVRIPVSGRLP
jgi:hypothetical protein